MLLKRFCNDLQRVVAPHALCLEFFVIPFDDFLDLKRVLFSLLLDIDKLSSCLGIYSPELCLLSTASFHIELFLYVSKLS